MKIYVIAGRNMELDNGFVVIPKQRLHVCHFRPRRRRPAPVIKNADAHMLPAIGKRVIAIGDDLQSASAWAASDNEKAVVVTGTAVVFRKAFDDGAELIREFHGCGVAMPKKFSRIQMTNASSKIAKMKMIKIFMLWFLPFVSPIASTPPT